MKPKRLMLCGIASGLAACSGIGPPMGANLGPQPAPDVRQAAEAYQARQLPTAADWDRAALLRLAMQQNPDLAEVRAQVSEVRAGEQSAAQLRNPTLEISGAYVDVASGASAVAFGIGNAGWLYGVAMDVLLPQSGARARRREAAALRTRVMEVQAAEALWALRMRLRAAEVEVCDAQARAALLDTQADLWRLRLADETLRVEAGAMPRTALTRIQTELAAARRLRVAAQAQEQAARVALAQSLGYPAAAVAGLVIDWPEWRDISSLMTELPAEWRAQALAQRPELQLSLREFDLADNALRNEAAQRWGEWHLLPGFSWDDDSRQYTLGLSFAPPLLNRNQGPIAEALAARLRAGQHVLAVQAGLIADMEQAESGWHASVQAWHNSVQALQRAQVQRDQRSRLQREGGIDRPALREADIAVLTQELAVLDASHAAQVARAELEDAYRRPLDGPEQRLPAELMAALP